MFSWQHYFWRTLRGFRSAVIRWAFDIRKHYIKREYTHLVEQVGEATRLKYSTLIAVSPHGHWQLTSELQRYSSARSRKRKQQRTERAQDRPRAQQYAYTCPTCAYRPPGAVAPPTTAQAVWGP